jgi:hypothetical protein
VGKLGDVGIFAVHVFQLRNVGIFGVVGQQRNVGQQRDVGIFGHVGIVRNVGEQCDVGILRNVGEQCDVGILRNVGQQRVGWRTELNRSGFVAT